MIKQKQPKNFTKIRRVSLVLFAVFLSVGFLLANQPASPTSALSDAELRAQAAALQQQINENNARAKELAAQADSLQRTVNALQVQINQATAEIQLIDVKLQQLAADLERAQAELERQKGLLKASMRALYKRGGASTVELLVGSDSFSQFINDQEYLERLKGAIQDSTEKVIALKLQIQAQQDEQTKLKAQQEAQRTILEQNKAEQASILAATQGEESRYRERTRELVSQQKAINRELLKRSRVIVGTGNGGYPYSDAVCIVTGQYHGDCWNYEWRWDDGSVRDPWGYYIRNCTSWAAWRSALNGHEVPSSMGHGGQWYANSPSYARGHTPQVGALASFSSGGFGHVVYVEEVLGGGEIRISEFNFVADGEYSERIISASQPTGYVYPWAF